MKVDWSNAPEGATHYANGDFWKDEKFRCFIWMSGGWMNTHDKPHSYTSCQSCPKDWPTETRIEQIGRNGGDGLHYSKSAADYLSKGLQILSERGNQYGSNSRECSFPQVAEAFNAITGNELSGSDVCMILTLLKLVRQSAQPDRLHEDSLVDGVNYMALYAEVLSKEITLK